MRNVSTPPTSITAPRSRVALERDVQRAQRRLVALADDQRADGVVPGPARRRWRSASMPDDRTLGDLRQPPGRLAGHPHLGGDRPEHRGVALRAGVDAARACARSRASARRRVAGSMRVMLASAASVEPAQVGALRERVELLLEHVRRLGARRRSGRARPASSIVAREAPLELELVAASASRRWRDRRAGSKLALRGAEVEQHLARAGRAVPARRARAAGRSRRRRRAPRAEAMRAPRRRAARTPTRHRPAGSAAAARRRARARRPRRRAARAARRVVARARRPGRARRRRRRRSAGAGTPAGARCAGCRRPISASAAVAAASSSSPASAAAWRSGTPLPSTAAAPARPRPGRAAAPAAPRSRASRARGSAR